MKIIGICGKKRSGKDTVAHAISALSPTMTYSLAYPLKCALAAGFSGIKTNQGYLDYDAFNGEREDIDREAILDIPLQQVVKSIGIAFAFVGKDIQELLGAKKVTEVMQNLAIQYNENDGFSMRNLMQIVGTDIGCNILGNNIWLEYALTTWATALDKGIYEYFVIPDIRQSHEIRMFRAMGAEILHLDNNVINNDDSHITEGGITPNDGESTIINDGTLDDLFNAVKKYLSTL